MRLDGLRFLITGASAGIGAALAREIAQQVPDAHLVLAARRQAELDAVADDARARGAQARAVLCDLADPGAADELARTAEAAWGGIDVLVNNAGVELISPMGEERTPDAGDRLMQVNLLGPLRLTSRLLGGMRARGSGAVAIVSSIAAFGPFPDNVHYAASKAALSSAAESLRIELDGSGIHVLAVYPGPIRTRMLAEIDKQSRRGFVMRAFPYGDAEPMARHILDALEADRQRVFYPGFYRTSAWFTSIARLMVRLAHRRDTRPREHE